jgi:hypothetical protein
MPVLRTSGCPGATMLVAKLRVSVGGGMADDRMLSLYGSSRVVMSRQLILSLPMTSFQPVHKWEVGYCSWEVGYCSRHQYFPDRGLADWMAFFVLVLAFCLGRLAVSVAGNTVLLYYILYSTGTCSKKPD